MANVDLSSLYELLEESKTVRRSLAYCPLKRIPPDICHRYIDASDEFGWNRPHPAALIDQMIREAEPAVQGLVLSRLAAEDEHRREAELMLRVHSECRLAVDREFANLNESELDRVPCHPLSPSHKGGKSASNLPSQMLKRQQPKQQTRNVKQGEFGVKRSDASKTGKFPFKPGATGGVERDAGSIVKGIPSRNAALVPSKPIKICEQSKPSVTRASAVRLNRGVKSNPVHRTHQGRGNVHKRLPQSQCSSGALKIKQPGLSQLGVPHGPRTCSSESKQDTRPGRVEDKIVKDCTAREFEVTAPNFSLAKWIVNACEVQQHHEVSQHDLKERNLERSNIIATREVSHPTTGDTKVKSAGLLTQTRLPTRTAVALAKPRVLSEAERKKMFPGIVDNQQALPAKPKPVEGRTKHQFNTIKPPETKQSPLNAATSQTHIFESDHAASVTNEASGAAGSSSVVVTTVSSLSRVQEPVRPLLVYEHFDRVTQELPDLGECADQVITARNDCNLVDVAVAISGGLDDSVDDRLVGVQDSPSTSDHSSETLSPSDEGCEQQTSGQSPLAEAARPSAADSLEASTEYSTGESDETIHSSEVEHPRGVITASAAPSSSSEPGTGSTANDIQWSDEAAASSGAGEKATSEPSWRTIRAARSYRPHSDRPLGAAAAARWAPMDCKVFAARRADTPTDGLKRRLRMDAFKLLQEAVAVSIKHEGDLPSTSSSGPCQAGQNPESATESSSVGLRKQLRRAAAGSSHQLQLASFSPSSSADTSVDHGQLHPSTASGSGAVVHQTDGDGEATDDQLSDVWPSEVADVVASEDLPLDVGHVVDVGIDRVGGSDQLSAEVQPTRRRMVHFNLPQDDGATAYLQEYSVVQSAGVCSTVDATVIDDTVSPLSATSGTTKSDEAPATGAGMLLAGTCGSADVLTVSVGNPRAQQVPPSIAVPDFMSEIHKPAETSHVADSHDAASIDATVDPVTTSSHHRSEMAQSAMDACVQTSFNAGAATVIGVSLATGATQTSPPAAADVVVTVAPAASTCSQCELNVRSPSTPDAPSIIGPQAADQITPPLHRRYGAVQVVTTASTTSTSSDTAAGKGHTSTPSIPFRIRSTTTVLPSPSSSSDGGAATRPTVESTTPSSSSARRSQSTDDLSEGEVRLPSSRRRNPLYRSSTGLRPIQQVLADRWRLERMGQHRLLVATRSRTRALHPPRSPGGIAVASPLDQSLSEGELPSVGLATREPPYVHPAAATRELPYACRTPVDTSLDQTVGEGQWSDAEEEAAIEATAAEAGSTSLWSGVETD